MTSRRVWRYQRGNQNPYNEEEQTTQWPKEKVQKDKQRSTLPLGTLVVTSLIPASLSENPNRKYKIWNLVNN
jgi:hypothetical protein